MVNIFFKSLNKFNKYSPLISTILAIVVLLLCLIELQGNFINIIQIGLLISTPVIVYIFSKFLVYFFQSKEETKTSTLLTSLIVILISVSPVITIALPLFSKAEYSKNGFVACAKISDLPIDQIAVEIVWEMQHQLVDKDNIKNNYAWRKQMFLNSYLNKKTPEEIRKFLTKGDNHYLWTLFVDTERAFFDALVEKAGFTEEELIKIFKLNQEVQDDHNN